MLLVCTAMLYNDDPTVLVRTVPAFLLVIATATFQFLRLKSSIGEVFMVETYPKWHVHKDIPRPMMRLRNEPNLREGIFWAESPTQ
jgi:hypothetical protein